MTNHNINLVSFLSEGPPNDNGLNIIGNFDLLLKSSFPYFNQITIYTPKILRDLGYAKYVMEYKNTGLVTKNNGLSKIGFAAWKPKIILLELDKMNLGDILIYRDGNIKKYPVLKNYSGIRDIAINILKYINFDFFIPREDKCSCLKNYAKTNLIRELGDDHPFSYNFPNLICNFLIIRKSDISVKLIKEWDESCLNQEWINGLKYGALHPKFRWSCPEQSILGLIIANWIRKNQHGIPQKYPFVGFKQRDIYKLIYYKLDDDYNYLKYLDNR